MFVERAIVVAILLGAISFAMAGPTPAPVRTEIDGLLARLEASGCEFYRNGTWYDASEAKAHLLRKLEFIERRRTIEKTEQFIAWAGTSSSMSGKAYEVRCDGAAPVPSEQWLEGELAELRSDAIESSDE